MPEPDDIDETRRNARAYVGPSLDAYIDALQAENERLRDTIAALDDAVDPENAKDGELVLDDEGYDLCESCARAAKQWVSEKPPAASPFPPIVPIDPSELTPNERRLVDAMGPLDDDSPMPKVFHDR